MPLETTPSKKIFPPFVPSEEDYIKKQREAADD